MRAGFTIIEVMVSVIIIVFVGWGILNMQQNSTHNLTVIQKGWAAALLASPLVIHADKSDHKRSRTLYDFVKDRYVIDYDPMIKEMKSHTFAYTQKRYSFINLSQEDNGTVSGNKAPKMGIQIDKVTIHEAKKGGTTAFGFELVQ